MTIQIRVFTSPTIPGIALAALLSACGGDGDSQVDTSNAQGETISAYVALRAMISENQGSGFSNEVQINTEQNRTASLTWEEPTRQMDGECLTTPIMSYHVHYGQDSRDYNGDPVIVARDSAILDCSAVDNDECGDVVHCTATVEF